MEKCRDMVLLVKIFGGGDCWQSSEECSKKAKKKEEEREREEEEEEEEEACEDWWSTAFVWMERMCSSLRCSHSTGEWA